MVKRVASKKTAQSESKRAGAGMHRKTLGFKEIKRRTIVAGLRAMKAPAVSCSANWVWRMAVVHQLPLVPEAGNGVPSLRERLQTFGALVIDCTPCQGVFQLLSCIHGVLAMELSQTLSKLSNSKLWMLQQLVHGEITDRMTTGIMLQCLSW